MAQIIELLDYLKKYPVFTNTILQNNIDKSREYTNLLLYRLKKRKLIYQIEKDKYTLYNDAFLIASRLIWPSYISCWSSLKFHNMTEQVVQNITVVTTRDKMPIRFNNIQIIFVKLKAKNFFGYEKVKYENFEIFMADKEKSIIDSAILRKVSFQELREIISANFKIIDINKLVNYLKRTGNKSLIKRLGYLFESLGKDCYSNLKKYIDATYIPLDYSKRAEDGKKTTKKTQKRNKKWRLIINA